MLLVYLGASAASLLQGRVTATVVQRMVFRLREQVQAKLSRLPLSYFDRQPRGEILSRVTNDIDNLAQSLQQTMSQLVISLLTIVGVLTVMFLDLAAAGADRAGHRPGLGVRRSARSASGPSRSSSSSGRPPAS